MTAAKPLARYGAVEGALASGFATAELHHLGGHDLDWYFKKRLSQLDEELTPTVQPPSSAATEAGMGGQEDE